MQPYEFVSGTESLIEQPDGQWIAQFDAYIYDGQTLAEISNMIEPGNWRVIEFEVNGDELAPLAGHSGASLPYQRGSEHGVELVLMRDGKKKGHIRTNYP